MSKWTFEPPFPDIYEAAECKKLFIAAEPNGDNDRPGKRDMGEWLRNVPKTGTKFYRSLVSIAAAFEGIDVDVKGPFDVQRILGEWRFIDLVSEEAGSSVQGDFKKRVKNNLSVTIDIIMKDKPDVTVLLGDHCQRAFEEIVVPKLNLNPLKRLGLPHPSSRVGGYITRGVVGDPNRMLRSTNDPLLSYGHRSGWVEQNKSTTK